MRDGALGEHGREVLAAGEQRRHVHLLARHVQRQREALAHGVPRAAVQAVFLRQEVEVLDEDGVAVLDGDLRETEALALVLHVLGVAHGHGKDGRVPHLRDERGSRVQLGRAIAFAATGSLGHDPHDLVALQHARGALDGGAVGRVALDGKRAHARQHLAHQAVRVAEQVLAPEEAHPLRGPSGQVHERHVEERRMVADDHHPGLVLETAQTLAAVDPVAEADLEHES